MRLLVFTLSFRTPAPPAPPPPPAPMPGPSNGVPLGNGGRSADPSSGRLPLPNMSSVVQAVARANPGVIQNSCQDNGHCGASPSAGWNDVTDVTLNSGTIGRWTSRGRF
ncbi:MAG: hypothetical protein EXQ54_03940 [Acidobacteria bacterium]|nr:hypothetical protein [Acidobacteriota bacterium]